jgi:hypothetical protein
MGVFIIAKNQNAIAKRQRELEKKRKAEEKRNRRTQRKAAEFTRSPDVSDEKTQEAAEVE